MGGLGEQKGLFERCHLGRGLQVRSRQAGRTGGWGRCTLHDALTRARHTVAIRSHLPGRQANGHRSQQRLPPEEGAGLSTVRTHQDAHLVPTTPGSLPQTRSSFQNEQRPCRPPKPGFTPSPGMREHGVRGLLVQSTLHGLFARPVKAT